MLCHVKDAHALIMDAALISLCLFFIISSSHHLTHDLNMQYNFIRRLLVQTRTVNPVPG